MKLRLSHQVWAAGIFLLCLTPCLNAQELQQVHPLLGGKLVVNAGGLFASQETFMELQGEIPVDGRGVDFEKDLGLKGSEQTLSGNVFWRLGTKWSLQFQHIKSSRSAGKVTDRDIEWGNVVYEQGSEVLAQSHLNINRLLLGHSLQSGPGYEIGAGIGVHFLDFSGTISGQAIMDGEPAESFGRSASASVPLPDIGAWYIYSPSPRLAVSVRLDWLSASLGNYSGGFTNTSVALHYRFFEHVGVNVAYQHFHLDLDTEKTNWQGHVELTHTGPLLALELSW